MNAYVQCLTRNKHRLTPANVAVLEQLIAGGDMDDAFHVLALAYDSGGNPLVIDADTGEILACVDDDAYVKTLIAFWQPNRSKAGEVADLFDYYGVDKESPSGA